MQHPHKYACSINSHFCKYWQRFVAVLYTFQYNFTSACRSQSSNYGQFHATQLIVLILSQMWKHAYRASLIHLRTLSSLTHKLLLQTWKTCWKSIEIFNRLTFTYPKRCECYYMNKRPRFKLIEGFAANKRMKICLLYNELTAGNFGLRLLPAHKLPCVAWGKM